MDQTPAKGRGKLALIMGLAETNPVLAGVLIVALVVASVLGGRMTKKERPPEALNVPVLIAGTTAPNRGPIVNAVIRQKLMDKLREAGVNRVDARRMAYEALQDETIDVVAADVLGTQDGPIQGSILDWLKEHGPQILEIVMKLLTLLMMFA